jgi:hypothetical protein
VTDGVDNEHGEAWFAGDWRSEDERRFLHALRMRAASWDIEGLKPAASQTLGVMVTLIVVVEDPRLEGLDGLTSVQVGYRPPEAEVGVRLQGEWGDDYLLDNGGDDTDLWVQGVAAEPEDFAQMAASWMERQLRRPLERLAWLDGDRVVASRVRLAEGGQTLVREGSWLRTIRRDPDQVTRLGT